MTAPQTQPASVVDRVDQLYESECEPVTPEFYEPDRHSADVYADDVF